MVSAYVRFTFAHWHVVDMMITSIEYLPEAERHTTRQAEHIYVDEWVNLTRLVSPKLDPTTARFAIARTPSLRRNLHTPAATERICTQLLVGHSPPDAERDDPR